MIPSSVLLRNRGVAPSICKSSLGQVCKPDRITVGCALLAEFPGQYHIAFCPIFLTKIQRHFTLFNFGNEQNSFTSHSLKVLFK